MHESTDRHWFCLQQTNTRTMKWTFLLLEIPLSLKNKAQQINYVSTTELNFLQTYKPECIPVGCIPPAAVAASGSGRFYHTPFHLSPQVDRQTPMKILTCPKLRLRVVSRTNYLLKMMAPPPNALIQCETIQNETKFFLMTRFLCDKFNNLEEDTFGII